MNDGQIIGVSLIRDTSEIGVGVEESGGAYSAEEPFDLRDTLQLLKIAF